ncbi:hypothetical protein [Streptomyces marincola]|uniref:hypothetical protein n=1 Tax=Streptomyces marincola TaxID=2878388 RepID=UPI001CF1D476|nr:hypothetical protein [Streptomyces marincola]UCM91475.1 hypothetical protein LC193_27950 [Streptomyces marincola]
MADTLTMLLRLIVPLTRTCLDPELCTAEVNWEAFDTLWTVPFPPPVVEAPKPVGLPTANVCGAADSVAEPGPATATVRVAAVAKATIPAMVNLALVLRMTFSDSQRMVRGMGWRWNTCDACGKNPARPGM